MSDHSKWDYSKEKGPEKWGDLDKSYELCKIGKHQSPINIENAIEDHSHQLTLHYTAAPLKVKLNHHSLYVHFIDTPDQVIEFDHQTYKMIQLHFHEPSEHHLNKHPFPMEVHCVHQNQNKEFLVIGVFIKEGKHNSYLETLLNNLPKTLSEDIVNFDAQLNPMDLIPENQTFYNYPGSLTTPPCSEGVNWIVMHEAIEASKEQIQLFKDRVIAGNIRPIQPLNDRIITITEKE